MRRKPHLGVVGRIWETSQISSFCVDEAARLVLPAGIIAKSTQVIGDNVVPTFSLVAAVSGVRFRARQMSDGLIELLSRARSGDNEALGDLCVLYRNYLRKLVRRGLGSKLGERVELADVLQEVFVEIVRQFPKFTGENEAAVMGWMQRLVSQRLADLGRYHRRVKRAGDAMAVMPLDVDPRDSILIPRGEWAVARQAGPEPDQPRASWSASASNSTPWPAGFAGLAKQEADVLWCYFADGLSFEAIGQRLNLSRKAVSRIVGQSLRKLKRSLDGPPGGALRYEQGQANRDG